MRFGRLFLIAALLFPALTPLPSAAEDAVNTPILSVTPELNQLQKWHDSNGDTADPFWADDDQLYHFMCDGRGFGTQAMNICFNKLTGPDLLSLKGSLINPMEEYGKANATEPDGATWKVCGQECVDGVFYAFVARNIYGNKSKDPILRQTSFNASLIKSTDRGQTWTRSASENYKSPMWPGSRFGAPGFFHFGKNGGSVTRDQADKFVYALSNNGFWNGGDDFILARVRRSALPKLNAADWQYYSGGNSMNEGSWRSDITLAKPILSLPGKLGWTAPVFIPALNRYLLVSWHVTPTLRKWFAPNEVVYEFYDAPHPWGPWNYISSFSDRFLSTGNMYGPNLCAKYQEKRGDDVLLSLFTSGCQFEDKPSGLYKMWRIPLVLGTRPRPHATLVNDDHPFVRYFGNWQASTNRGYHDFMDDVHVSASPGDAVELTFNSSGVEWLTERYSDEGTAEVFIDGEPRGKVDLKLENWPRLARIPVFSAQGLADGPHTIRIVNTGTNYVLIDAFSITTHPATSQPRP
ncbi:MAG TPA: hypothetical protein P5205_21010 [Candidatus Paceibacterota bacterium]|nr:hypothetical protein [Verrucomicrobiota bacterium]HSA12844.1 hypothetical protein [Candidatus Paceibacterota bacterium]